MNSFKFKFAAILDFRRHRRDMRRQLLARLIEDDRQLLDERRKWENYRTDQLDQIRSLGQPGELNVDQLSKRRYYAGQLVAEINMIERRRQVIQQQLEMCRQALVEADRDVKALEKLQEKALAEFQYVEGRREAREMEENWSASHLSGGVL